MKQNKLSAGPVLDEAGRPVAGYSTRAVLRYDRRAIRAKPWRIKEWDYYQISDNEKCLELTFGHASYVGQLGIMMFDFRKGRWIAKESRLIPLPFSGMHLPASAEEDSVLSAERGGLYLRLETRGQKRFLTCRCHGFDAEVELDRRCSDSIVVNIPFDQSPRQFYYNQKINCMTARGTIRAAGSEYNFSPSDSFGLLDWGRGVWPFSNEWYWSNGTGLVDGKLFGFNLGCGFGNPQHGTENILFYDGVPHKLEDVEIRHEADYLRPWRLQDRAGRVDLTMEPLFDRTTRDKVLFVDNCCHQVFGLFQGKVRLDDGVVLTIRDLPAFAEHARNNW